MTKPDKKHILAIDTATKSCNVALSSNDDILVQKSKTGRAVHNKKLAVFVNDIFNEFDLEVKDLKGVAVNIGPGSFTGLRIGVGTAKGLVFPYNLPVLPVGTFSILKWKLSENNMDKIVFIKSHRNKVYYINDQQDNILNPEVQYGEIENLIDNNKSTENIFGNHSFDCLDDNFNKIDTDARTLALIGNKFFDELQEKDKDDLEPFYLTNFEAKKWKPGIKDK